MVREWHWSGKLWKSLKLWFACRVLRQLWLKITWVRMLSKVDMQNAPDGLLRYSLGSIRWREYTLAYLQLLEIWNFIDAPWKFNCQLKYDNMPITEPNLVMSLNPRNCHLTILCAVLLKVPQIWPLADIAHSKYSYLLPTFISQCLTEIIINIKSICAKVITNKSVRGFYGPQCTTL